MNSKNRYPFIFVHGMFGWGSAVGIDKIAPYWGSTTGNLMKYLSAQGYECCSASVGPVSSAWDCACELYAQLCGTRVDYGVAHSKRHSHERFGRTYKKPLICNFGKTKIHLIGHSHGGQVIRLLAHLLTYGDEDEINSTDESNISGLFTGGKEDWISSITTVCTPNNGTTLYYLAEKANIIPPLGRATDFAMAIIGRTFIHGRLVDFQLEQYGLTPLKDERKADKIITAMNKMRDTDDNVLTDLSFKGAFELNKKIRISKNINYFCYTSNGCSPNDFKPHNIKFPILKPLSRLISKHELPQEQYGLTFDRSWHENDGLVNTPSGKNPINDPAKEFDGKIEPGIWNIMPVLTGDHGQATGLFADKTKLHEFYNNLAEMLIGTEAISIK
ncbi:MAG: hypothetical protein IJE19_01320 [Clostridia bacterium]|nr:hypothetical protein [Clostridia bacterium]